MFVSEFHTQVASKNCMQVHCTAVCSVVHVEGHSVLTGTGVLLPSALVTCGGQGERWQLLNISYCCGVIPSQCVGTCSPVVLGWVGCWLGV